MGGGLLLDGRSWGGRPGVLHGLGALSRHAPQPTASNMNTEKALREPTPNPRERLDSVWGATPLVLALHRGELLMVVKSGRFPVVWDGIGPI